MISSGSPIEPNLVRFSRLLVEKVGVGEKGVQITIVIQIPRER
jgi:hypothetical protein